ncbi:MAG: hypothetical protein DKINENOH_05231 [bacterium]|nr:hypothetical protein [bacterium]
MSTTTTALTPRQRILTAMRRQIPDHVPVMPDISNMVPCRLLGKPFWEIYLHEDPPLAEAYLQAVKYFGIDGWYIYDNLTMYEAPKWQERVLQSSEEELQVERWLDTPYGRLAEVVCYPRADPPWHMSAMIKDIAQDFPKLRWYLEQRPLEDPCRNRGKIGELGIYGLGFETFMGFWVWLREGGSMQALRDFYEQPELMRQVQEYYFDFVDRMLDRVLPSRPDEILINGSSSSLSLSSPAIYRQYDLPIIQRIAGKCRQTGVICHQHTCGRSRLIVEINYHETEINVMEPLERPPGGDVDLAEVKRKFGDKFCLKGNVNTFETMLNGTAADVMREARACIDAAAAGGGFILATGDQCGRDTPDENLFALVEVAKTYGRYV